MTEPWTSMKGCSFHDFDYSCEAQGEPNSWLIQNWAKAEEMRLVVHAGFVRAISSIM